MAFIGWSGLTVLWAASPYEWGLGFWQLGILAGVYCLGASLDSKILKRCLIGLALAISVSGWIALAQKLGWVRPPGVYYESLDTLFRYGVAQSESPSGLFMNKNFLAEASIVAFVILIIYRSFLSLLLIPGILLPWCREVIVAGVLIIAGWAWSRSRLITLGLVLSLTLALASVKLNGTSAGGRTEIWINSMKMVWDHPLGIGLNNFWNVYPLYHDALVKTGPEAYQLSVRPKHPHNEFVSILTETGIPGFILFMGFLASILVRDHKLKPVLWVILFEGLFGFPLHLPVTAIAFALCAGAVSRGSLDRRVVELLGRIGIPENRRRIIEGKLDGLDSWGKSRRIVPTSISDQGDDHASHDDFPRDTSRNRA